MRWERSQILFPQPVTLRTKGSPMSGQAIDRRSAPQTSTSGAVVLAVGRLVAARSATAAPSSQGTVTDNSASVPSTE